MYIVATQWHDELGPFLEKNRSLINGIIDAKIAALLHADPGRFRELMLQFHKGGDFPNNDFAYLLYFFDVKKRFRSYFQIISAKKT